jgi:hypothetical protein
MTNIFKRVVIGLLPAFALSAVVLILISDQVTDGGEFLIPVFLLSPFLALFLAWLIGHLIFAIQSLTIRSVTFVVIILVSVGAVYVFGTNCDLQLSLGRRCNRLEKPATVYVNDTSTSNVRYPNQ